MAKGAIKPEAHWTQDERRVVIQDQRLKSIIMSCLPDDIMESVVSCETAKDTWTDLVHSFKGPSNTKENRIMNLKLKYQTFRDFQENSDDEVDERSSEEYLKDLDIKFHERVDPKIQTNYKVEYKKMKAKLALLEASSSISQTPKTFQPKNKGLVAETFIGMGKRKESCSKWRIDWHHYEKGNSQGTSREEFHENDYAKEIGKAIRTRLRRSWSKSKEMQKAIQNNSLSISINPFSEGLKKGYDRFQQLLSQLEAHGAGKKEQNQNCLLIMDNGVVNWGEHTVEEEETNHALMAISSNNESNEVLSYEEEMNRYVFKCTAEDYINKPLYSRFTKTNSFKGVPHPLTGDYTPKPQEKIDDSLYVCGKKGPQKPEISDSDDNYTEHSTCQSNDSEGSCGNTSEHSSESESESIM
ncbi:hypothetical protein Tco_1204155 [Tanacetum coccineum]